MTLIFLFRLEYFVLLVRGLVREGDSVLIGPSVTGEFYPVCVESLHRNKAACRIVQAGQAASVALGDFKDVAVRKVFSSYLC